MVPTRSNACLSTGVSAHDRERAQRPRLCVRGGRFGVNFFLPGVPHDRAGQDQGAEGNLRPGDICGKRFRAIWELATAIPI